MLGGEGVECGYMKVCVAHRICTLCIMVLILDGNSDIDTHVRNNLCYLMLFKAFDQIRAVPSCVLNMFLVTI